MPKKGKRLASSKGMVLAKVREMEALKLRRAGATYDQIAKTIAEAQGKKFTREGARRAVIRALAALQEQVAEEATEVLSLELQRLDAMLLGAWDKAAKGDDKAIATVLRIMERRDSYLGLSAPKRVALGGDPDGSPLTFLEAAKKVFAAD